MRRDPLERGPGILVASGYGSGREQPVFHGDCNDVCFGGSGGDETVVVWGESGLHAVPAAVDIEKDREFSGRVGYWR